MSEIRQDKPPLASSMIRFVVTTKNPKETILVNKSIFYLMVELLLKYHDDPPYCDLKRGQYKLLYIASLLFAVYDHRITSI